VPPSRDAVGELADLIEGFNLMQGEVRQERDAVAAAVQFVANVGECRRGNHLAAGFDRQERRAQHLSNHLVGVGAGRVANRGWRSVARDRWVHFG
jgi:hypothetical protein